MSETARLAPSVPPLPEGRWSLAVAAAMIPMTSTHALYCFLNKHPEVFGPRGQYPPEYQLMGSGRGRPAEIRMLTTAAVERIREMITLTPETSRYYKRQRNRLAAVLNDNAGEGLEPVTFRSLFQ